MYSLATTAMIKHLGLNWSFRVLAILAFAVNGSCAFLIKDRNAVIGSQQQAFDIKLFR